MKKLSILIVDDNIHIRNGIKIILKNKRLWEYSIEEASNGEEALEFVAKKKYDIILMDISMPIMNGLDASIQILKLNPEQNIIVISMHSTKDEIEQFKQIGAKGYLLKEKVTEQLIETIAKVINGDSVFNLKYY